MPERGMRLHGYRLVLEHQTVERIRFRKPIAHRQLQADRERSRRRTTSTRFRALAVLYRYAADRDHPKWRWVSVGSVSALCGWLLVSVAFRLYVSKFASYNETYGALGSVVVLLTWLYLSAMAVILGAEINTEIERQTLVDSTVGEPEPIGQRGADAADYVATGPRRPEASPASRAIERD